MKLDTSQKILIGLCVFLIFFFGLFITLIVADNKKNSFSDDEISALLVAECSEKIELLKKELDVTELSVKLEGFTHTPPSLFKHGSISFDKGTTIYYTSDEFTELDNEIYNEDTFQKYDHNCFYYLENLGDRELENYSVGTFNTCATYFIDSSGDLYRIYTKDAPNGGYINIIEKNSEVVYEHKWAWSSSGSSNNNAPQPCALCNGTGVAKFYYGGSALEAWLDGYNDYEYQECPSCDGTGKIS